MAANPLNQSSQGPKPAKKRSIAWGSEMVRRLPRQTMARAAISISGTKLQYTVAGPASRKVNRPEVKNETAQPKRNAKRRGRRRASISAIQTGCGA
jgi:hypothetical protein